jgi:hypothetical protein
LAIYKSLVKGDAVMSNVSGTEQTPSKCVKREYTTGRRLQKMTLKMLGFLFIFGLGFMLGKLCSTEQTDQMDDSNQVAYAYDTEQKVEDFYKMFEIQFSEKTGLPPESPEVKEYMAMVRREQGRPLVAVGQFAVFVDNDGGKFSVREIQSVKQEANLLLPLVELKFSEQSKRLCFFSSVEKCGRLPRFRTQLTYSADGIYEKGIFSVYKEDGTFERNYCDTQGIGVFNTKCVSENGALNIYHLNDLTWEKADIEIPQDLHDRLDRVDEKSRAVVDVVQDLFEQ